MKIDGEIEPPGPQLAPEAEIADKSAYAARARRDDHLIEVRIALDDRRSRRLDDISEVGARETAPQRVDGGCRKDDVADLPEADEKNP